MLMTADQAKHQLDHMAPAAHHAKLGVTLDDIINAHNALATAHNAAMAKLDADAGVTDTNYTSLFGGVPQLGALGSR